MKYKHKECFIDTQPFVSTVIQVTSWTLPTVPVNMPLQVMKQLINDEQGLLCLVCCHVSLCRTLIYESMGLIIRLVEPEKVEGVGQLAGWQDWLL